MSNLLKRVLSALVLVPLVLALVFLSSAAVFVIAVSLVAGLAGLELAAMTISPRRIGLNLLVAFLSSALCLSLSLSLYSPLPFLVVIPLAVVSLFASFMFSSLPLDVSVKGFGLGLSCVVYCGSLLGFIGLVFRSNGADGPYWVLLLLLGTFLGDTGAYAAGRLLGKRKLCPSLSPGKTWAGAAGGLTATTLSVFAVRYFVLTDITLAIAISLSLSLSIFCQLGDLAESFLKRGFGVKDSGKLIPGHGGLLDRIDALMFGAPIVFLFSMLN